MTKYERARIRKALRLVMDADAGFADGIEILARLAGLEYPAARILKGAKLLDIRKLASRPNQRFAVSLPKPPKGPPICEEDGAEMEFYGNAGDTGNDGYRCPKCGWSFDVETIA